ncbi:MAG: ADP-ribosylglycohydrolase family protein, partial [Tepidiformaceae bacterium]
VVLRGVTRALKNQWDLDQTMSSIAEGIADWGLTHDPSKAPGSSCLAGSAALRAGAHWSIAGAATAGGCGSVMRAYPFALGFERDKAISWSVEHSKMTHRDPIALAACAGMAAGMVAALGGEGIAAIVDAMIAAAAKDDPATAEMMAVAAAEAQAGVPVEVTLQQLQGWAAHEAIAAAAYVITRHPDDIVAGILEAANTPGDSDSIATLVGALLGARLGIAALPSDWVRDVERSAELLSLAGGLSSLVAATS